MASLKQLILEATDTAAEGALITADMFDHLDSRTRITRTLSTLKAENVLVRVQQGVYARTVNSRFGTRPPAIECVVEALARRRGETIAPQGAEAANRLGLTTQVPMRVIYWTSGPSRHYRLGTQNVELRHVEAWKVALADHPAGEILRALAWAGPMEARTAMKIILRRAPDGAFETLKAITHLLPSWVNETLRTVPNSTIRRAEP